MLARGRTQLGAVVVAIALAAPASAFALSTGPTEIGSHASAVAVRARSDAGERHFQRTRSMPAVRNASKVAVESRKWVSPDPLFLNDPAQVVGKPLEGGLYGYVGNNPVNATDPTGQFANIVAGAFIGAIAGAVLEGARQLSSGEYSGRDFGVAVAGGAVFGAIAGATWGASIPVQAGVGAGAAMTAGSLTHGIRGETYTVPEAMVDAELGGLFGAAGGAQSGVGKALPDAPPAPKVGGGGAGRGGTRLKPETAAVGPHSTFKTNAGGQVTGHAEWTPNAQNPSGFDQAKRVDTQYGNPHAHSGVSTPHAHDKVEGVRPARSDELPK